MKKLLQSGLVLLLAAFILTACGGNAAPSSHSIHPDADVSEIAPPTPATSSSAAQNSGAPPADSSLSAPQPAPSSSEAPVEQSVTGIVDDVATGQLFVLLEDGQVVTFVYTSADISGWSDTRPGAGVTVYFYGTLGEGTLEATRIVTT